MINVNPNWTGNIKLSKRGTEMHLSFEGATPALFPFAWNYVFSISIDTQCHAVLRSGPANQWTTVSDVHFNHLFASPSILEYISFKQWPFLFSHFFPLLLNIPSLMFLWISAFLSTDPYLAGIDWVITVLYPLSPCWMPPPGRAPAPVLKETCSGYMSTPEIFHFSLIILGLQSALQALASHYPIHGSTLMTMCF